MEIVDLFNLLKTFALQTVLTDKNKILKIGTQSTLSTFNPCAASLSKWIVSIGVRSL